MTKKYSVFIIAAVSVMSIAIMPMAQAAQNQQKTKHIAQAQPRKIIIQKRSFLNSGTQVPIGSMSHYMNDSTVLHVPVYRQIFPSRFGGDVLPGRFDMPGRPVPLFTF